MIAYLDTHVGLSLTEARKDRLPKKARKLAEEAELLISPVVLIEWQYLYEIRRTEISSREVLHKLEHELDVRLCVLPFPTIAHMALEESWTRDAFDRIIVANAKANGFALLISSDERIAKHYPRTVW